MAVRALAISATLAIGHAAADEYFTGDGTSYTLSEVSSGNCNFMSAMSSATSNYAALNQEQWDSLANCGRCAEVWCIDDACASMNNATEIVQILDRCPECKSGDLDLSPTVFKSITGSDPSRFTIQWRFVDCPTADTGNIEVCLKSGSNSYWTAVQPTNFINGVESVTVNGGTTTMLDGAYYFVIEDSAGIDLTSVEVSITSMNGDVVTDTYSLTAGSCTDTNEQFSSSGGSSTSTTSAPATTTAAPTATTATPTSTTATPATTKAASTASSATDDSTGGEYDADESTEDDYDTGSSASTTTTAPSTTTAAPTATTTAPTTATAAPATTTATPASTSSTPSKCKVRSRN